MFLAHFLQAAGGLELEDCINELIIWNLKPLVASRMQWWIDYSNIEFARSIQEYCWRVSFPKNQFTIAF